MGSCEPAGCCIIALLWLEDRMQGTFALSCALPLSCQELRNSHCAPSGVSLNSASRSIRHNEDGTTDRVRLFHYLIYSIGASR